MTHASNRDLVVPAAGDVPEISNRTVSPRYVWYVIALLCVVNVFNSMDRMAISVLLPFIKSDLELSDGQLGLLIGFAFSLFYAMCGIPIAMWADRGVRRDIIAITLGVWSVMTALSGTAQNFWQLFLARVGVGAGEAGGLPPAQSLMCDYVPLERRAGVFAVHSFGAVGGLILGMGLAGWLGAVIGWRWTFFVLGLPGVVLALIVKLTLREPKRGTFDGGQGASARASTRNTLRFLWRCKTYRLLVMFLVVNGFIQFSTYQWLPSFYVRVFALDSSFVGIYLGIAVGTGSGIGVLLGGLLANRLVYRDVRLPLIVCAVATFLAMPTLLAALFAPSATISMLLCALTGFFWTMQAGPIVAANYSVMLPSMRATAGAISIFFTSCLGFGFGPFSVGLVSDLLSASAGPNALRYALLIPVVLLPVAVWLLLAAALRLPSDLRAAGVQIRKMNVAPTP